MIDFQCEVYNKLLSQMPDILSSGSCETLIHLIVEEI